MFACKCFYWWINTLTKVKINHDKNCWTDHYCFGKHWFKICVFIWFSFALQLKLFWVLNVCAIVIEFLKNIFFMFSWIDETNGYTTPKFFINEGEKKERINFDFLAFAWRFHFVFEHFASFVHALENVEAYSIHSINNEKPRFIRVLFRRCDKILVLGWKSISQRRHAIAKSTDMDKNRHWHLYMYIYWAIVSYFLNLK